MSRERAQAAASRQLASVGSETTAETTSRRMRVYALRIARTFVVHFEWEVSLRFQGGECLEGVQRLWGSKDLGHTFFIAVNFATLGSVKTAT